MSLGELIARADEGFVQELVKAATVVAGDTHVMDQPGSNSYKVIEENLEKASREKFMSDFGYAYVGDASTPMVALPGSVVKGFAGLVNTKIGPDIHISTYIKGMITNDLPIDDWAKEAISTDLTKFVSSLLAAHKAPFTYTIYQKSFTHPTQDDLGQNLCVQAAMHYGNIDAPNSEKEGDSTLYFFLYFSGVGYWVAKS
jgi:hypothetical protein